MAFYKVKKGVFMIKLKNVILTLEDADKLNAYGFNILVKNNELILERA